MLYMGVPMRDIGTPESALWCAVVVQALRDAGDRYEGLRARDWFCSRSEDIGSLRWICTVLDLDADRISTAAMTREGRARILRREANAVWGWGTEKWARGEG